MGLEPTINCPNNVENNFYEIFITCSAQIGPKIKNAPNLLKLGTFDILNTTNLILISMINDFNQIFTTCQAQVGPKIKSAHNLLKFCTLDISNSRSRF